VPVSANNGKIHQTWVFWIILGIMVLALVDILSNNVFATSLHDQTLYEMTKQTSGLDEDPAIDVGDSPQTIELWSYPNRNNLSMIYVANSDSNSISVISTENNTKIKDIDVGGHPNDMAVSNGLVYVASSSNVSVISTENNTKIKDIDVGGIPGPIAVSNGLVYVVKGNATNEWDNYVSVISIENNTKIGKDIPIGRSPGPIAVSNGLVYVASLNSSYLYVISVISIENNTKIGKDIPIGFGPNFIAVSSGLVYVAHQGDNYVSVISTENNTKIKNITVGLRPTDIAVSSGLVYVANHDSSNVSVISIENNTKIKDIDVGHSPVDIGVSTGTTGSNKPNIYLANELSNSISVISGETNTKIKDIDVGHSPVDIAVDYQTDTIYVANVGSDSVSVIDGVANRVVAGITFHVNPFNSGVILCNDLTTPSPDDLTPPSPLGQYTFVYSGTECMAKPNEGFEFSSWEENLGGNSTQVINVSRPASPLDSFLRSLHLMSPDKPEAILNITKFGTFTANFREAPPPLPPEFWVQMYAVIATVITALFIPSIVGWFKSKREAKKLNYFHKKLML